MIHLKSLKEIEIMREGGKILASVLVDLKNSAKPGVALEEIDKRGEQLIREAGATPSFKGYKASGMPGPYPTSICLSVNEEVVHGLTGDRVLEEGQVLTIDAGIYYKGFHTDSAITIGIGNVSLEAQKLIDVTKQSLEIAIGAAKPGVALGDIGYAIDKFVRTQGFSVVDGLVGHGIGRELQEEPIVPNFGKRRTGPELVEGMVLAIEPMVSAGKPRILLADDGFAYKTADGSLSAHFEHTVAITKGGREVLTEL